MTGKGWRREPARHSLARKGVRTKPRKSIRSGDEFVAFNVYKANFPQWTMNFIGAISQGDDELAWNVLKEHGFPSSDESRIVSSGGLLPTAVFRIREIDGIYIADVVYVDETGWHTDTRATRKFTSKDGASTYLTKLAEWCSHLMLLHCEVETTVLSRYNEKYGLEPTNMVSPSFAVEFLSGITDKERNAVPEFARPYSEGIIVGMMEIIKEDLR